MSCPANPVHLPLAALVVVAVAGVSPVLAQPPSFGPTSSQAVDSVTTWPAAPPTRIYVLPFRMDPALQQRLSAAAGPTIPQGPVRSVLAARPRVVDAVTGFDRNEPPGTAVARLVAEELAQAGWPAVFWSAAAAPPPSGWRLSGEVVNLDEGSAVARNMIGFGAGHATLGIDIALADPATADGRPFFVLDSSDRGRRAPGTLAIGAVAGFNPAVVAGKVVASNSGIADITQQRRLADEIAGEVATAINARTTVPAR